ncbi:hypothetical protein FHS14_006487 [Paenibacillus baekrokdamisoli]|nr:hypothetical protein [Paenibacillus baekrokdamisoli]MBB3073429.1 hypothetical protein [Paenibacillus baekrokdamisoli]
MSDDIACDVRDIYKELLGDNYTGEEATRLIIENYIEELDDPDDTLAFWLSLALTQWKLGRLQEDVKDKALQIIDNGEDLDRWDDPTELKKRQIVLKKLRIQLMEPQPAPKKLKKVFREQTHLRQGDVISYRLLSGRYVLLRVYRISESNGRSVPEFELYDWIGTEVPSREELELLAMRKTPSGVDGIVIVRNGVRDDPKDRINLIAAGLEIKHKIHSSPWIAWKELDDYMNRYYKYD